MDTSHIASNLIGYSSKNYVRKFLRVLYPKWRAKVTAIEESKDLTLLSLDELIVMKRVRLPEAKTKSMPWRLEISKSSSKEEEDSECLKPSRDKNQRAFVGGSWSDSGEEDEENKKDETCLMAQTSNEICLRIDLEPDEWIKDSGCTKHMTGNRNPFSSYKQNECEVMYYKQAHAGHKAKNIVSKTRCLELLDMDFFGPSAVWGYGGNTYTLVIVDDYSRMDDGREFDNEVQFGDLF
ncbi:hypothetical protein Tco_0616254 [Tanacetum coccineum]